jgi:predicted O-methyltransferase YrrM
MSLVASLRTYVGLARRKRALQRLASQAPRCPLTNEGWGRSLQDPTAYYEDAVRHFYHTLPQAFRDHRRYFVENGRGFGEHAFHVLWYALLNEIRPRSFLEIGVFRGQVISLVALWAKLQGQTVQVCGISPFSPAADSVSKYQTGLDYLADTLTNFEHFQLPAPELLKAFSTDAMAKSRIAAQSWDMVYIDGNHDYEVALQDWQACAPAVRQGGVIVLDDSSVSTVFQPPCFATKGHPGPSRLATEIDRSKFVEILQVGHNRVFQKR